MEAVQQDTRCLESIEMRMESYNKKILEYIEILSHNINMKYYCTENLKKEIDQCNKRLEFAIRICNEGVQALAAREICALKGTKRNLIQKLLQNPNLPQDPDVVESVVNSVIEKNIDSFKASVQEIIEKYNRAFAENVHSFNDRMSSLLQNSMAR